MLQEPWEQSTGHREARAFLQEHKSCADGCLDWCQACPLEGRQGSGGGGSPLAAASSSTAATPGEATPRHQAPISELPRGPVTSAPTTSASSSFSPCPCLYSGENGSQDPWSPWSWVFICPCTEVTCPRLQRAAFSLSPPFPTGAFGPASQGPLPRGLLFLTAAPAPAPPLTSLHSQVSGLHLRTSPCFPITAAHVKVTVTSQ